MNTETSTSLKLRLLNVTRKELQTDLEKGKEFDQSALFKKVYEEEYGTYGGNPYGLLLGDLNLGVTPRMWPCWKNFPMLLLLPTLPS